MSARPRFGSFVATCSCGKRGYATRREAKRAAKQTPPIPGRGHLDAYPCRLTDSGLFHTGHLPPAVIHGRASRDQIFTAPRLHRGEPAT